MQRQYCASIFVIDDNNKLLLMYNRKLNKWLQPGGHIHDDETPILCAIRELSEETGVKALISGEKLLESGDFLPISIEQYINKVGDMIDFQYFGIPTNSDLKNDENNKTGWFSIEEMKEMEVDSEIIEKAELLIKKYK